MKVKRQRQTRRHLRFFRTACGFHAPFKVLCDGNLVHHVAALRMTDVSQALPRLLGSPAKVFTTRCVVAELRQLGEAFKEATFQSRKLLTARCAHEGAPVPPSECLLSLVSGGNAQHFFVATQDSELRRRLSQMPGTAAIHARGTALVLDPPSEFQMSLTQHMASATQHMARHEHDALKVRATAGRARQLEAAGGANASGQSAGGIGLVRGENGLLEVGEGADGGEESGAGERGGEGEARVDWRKGYGSGSFLDADADEQPNRKVSRSQRLQAMLKDAPRFKRKRAKGPNPLSCKKKKTAASVPASSTPMQSAPNPEGVGRRQMRQRRATKALHNS